MSSTTILNVDETAPNGYPHASAADRVGELRSEMLDGMLYAHTRANSNTSKLLEVTAFSYALIELLQEKGLITVERLDARKNEMAARLAEKFRRAGMGAMLQEPEQDKYTFEGEAKIDCEDRLHLCKAACCKLAFALSKQDVEERIARWDIGHPYMNARAADGYCVHLQRQMCRCTIYQHRPLPCRAYDCRRDKRIWQDFENRVINPELDALFVNKNGDNHRSGENGNG